MIVPDVNLLIYAIDKDSSSHAQASAWLESALVGTEKVGFAWNVLMAFLRITTRPNFPKALSIEQAFAFLSRWLSSPNAHIVRPGPAHFELLRNLLTVTGSGGNLVADAHLAAIAIEYEAELYSNDSDFDRFPGLRWRNPLES